MEFDIKKMDHAKMRSGKRQIMEGSKLPNREKIKMLWEKETYKYLGILKVDTPKQVEIKGNIKKRVPQENEETIGNQIIKQNSHQRDKHLGCPTCKIPRTIHQEAKRRISTNGPENKKIHNNS